VKVASGYVKSPNNLFPCDSSSFSPSNNDILGWLLANHGQDPLNLLVVKSRPENEEDGAQMPEPANGRYPFLNRKVWADTVGAIPADEDEDKDGDEDEDKDEDEDEEWLDAESEEKPQAPYDELTIVLDDLSIDI